LDNTDIDWLQLIVAFPIKDNPSDFRVPTRQSRFAQPPFGSLFCNPNQQQDLIAEGNSSRVESANDFQIWLRRFEIRRFQEAFVK
jgi:hypothetical protein